MAGPRVFRPLAVVFLAACRSGEAPGPVTASGHIEATEVRLASKLPGTLSSLTLAEGDAVGTGQTVARLDPRDTELLLEQARAERDLFEAELRLRQAGSRREDIAEMESQVRALEADQRGAEAESKRMQGLLDQGTGTAQSRDDAKARAESIGARLSAMRAGLARVKAGSRSQELDAAAARLRAADARVAQLEQRLEDHLIVSPRSGVFTHKLAEAGEVLAAGAPLGVVTDLASPWLTIYVGETDLGRVRLGQEAIVTTDAGAERRGRVSFISAVAEFTPRNVQTREERVKLVYKVKVALDNRDGLFKSGMPAEARLGELEAGR